VTVKRKRVLMLVLPAVVLASAIIAVIAFGGGNARSDSKRVPPNRVRRLLAGIPQRGNVLGSPRAPVTLVEFADLQCPYCGEWARDTLPTIVRKYVRPGKVKIEFKGVHFLDRLGPDSQRGVRAAFAAGLQGKLWYVVEGLYERQGQEGSGWLSESLLKQVAAAVPGLDAKRMLADRTSPAVDAAIRSTDQLVGSIGVTGTPTFYAGKSNGTLSPLRLTSLGPDGVEPTLDKLLAG
jgi:protein-disulfide isomerase